MIKQFKLIGKGLNCQKLKFFSQKLNEEALEALSVELLKDAAITSDSAASIPKAMKSRLSHQFNVGHNHLGASIIPESLQLSLNRILKGYPRRQLRQDVALLAENYSKMTRISAESLLERNFEKSNVWSEANRQALIEFTSPFVEYGNKETYAYISSQLPFMLASVQNVLAEISRRIPDFAPKSMFDFGSGPGTAIVAAQKHWSSSLQDIMAVEISQSMIEMAVEILKDQPGIMTDRVQWRQYMPMNPNRPKYNLVVASTVLSELPDDHLRSQSVQHLWDQTDDILVLIDRGNAEGFRILRHARDQLIQIGREERLHIVAPVIQKEKF